jgi:hypothetical protein
MIKIEYSKSNSLCACEGFRILRPIIIFFYVHDDEEYGHFSVTKVYPSTLNTQL